MTTFELAGAAMLQAHEGSRQIAPVLAGSLRSIGGCVARFVRAALEAAPGPHLLP